MRLDIETFKGIQPKLASRLLSPETAESCLDCLFDAGNLEALEDNLPIAATLATNTQSLYLYDNTHWFSWPEDVDAIGSPIAQDIYDRVYFTDDVGAKVTSNLIATGGDPKPVAEYTLGVPAPDSAPVAAINNPGTGVPDDITDDETRIYIVTYVTEYGEEGPPSLASNSITLLAADATATVSSLPIPSTNTYNITHKRIYRSALSGDDTSFFFVAQVTLATTTYNDDKAGTELGGELSTNDFLEPPAGAKGITMMANGIVSMFTDNEVLFSEPYLPYAYPAAYRRTTEHPVVAMAATQTSLVVGTEGYPYIFGGISPDSMSQMKLELKQACVSKQSMVDMGNYVVYASPDGLVGVSESNADLITKELFDKRQWASYQPETIRAYYHEGKYIGFYGGSAGFYFDTDTGDFVPLDFYADAAYADLLTDSLYLVINDNLFKWRGHSTVRPFTWRSKVFQSPAIGFTAMKVWTDTPVDVGVDIYVDGSLAYSLASFPTTSVRIPDLVGREWQIELSGTATVERITLATSMAEL